jgi:hypothetical protein
MSSFAETIDSFVLSIDGKPTPTLARTPKIRSIVGVRGFDLSAVVSGWRLRTPSGLSGEDLSSKDNVPSATPLRERRSDVGAKVFEDYQEMVYHRRIIRSSGVLHTPSFQYDSLYISIGGKINEDAVRFTKPAILTNHDFQSNAQYQMVPAFIRYPRSRSSQTLVIVIDDFSDPELRLVNETVVDQIQQKHTHIRIVLYDTKLVVETIDDFAKSLVQWIIDQNLAPEKCMIANYLRFRGTHSVIDSQLEFKLPRVIQNALNAYTIIPQTNRPDLPLDETKPQHKILNPIPKTKPIAPYSGILYQWFGYQYYTYNIVFSYKEYNAYMLKHLTVMNLLEECCDMTTLVSGNVSNMFMFEKSREPKSVELLLTFLQHSVDITSYSKQPTAICSRMNEFVPEYVQQFALKCVR